MRFSPFATTLAAAAGLAMLPGALSAQAAASAPAPNASRPIGCRGTTSQTSSIAVDRPNADPVVFSSYGEIETVQPGSPAERAGMRHGDLVMVQDGHDLIADPPKQPRLAGDTVQFLVRRNGAEIPLTVVLGRWDPPQEAPGVTRVCRPVSPNAAGG
jgi:hypothetical protein